ncbi:hypothetical protein D7294_30030 [Streptomyces hoynatensis]|uniref:Uncharacterized protein n=1 Tax=Streptomyces hoynatensis TaxID=1141874 RepID=A0A3A9YMT9_9ACTN|nr:hypothetical protein D7294_30030 [Streptomyces hoynatensis]
MRSAAWDGSTGRWSNRYPVRTSLDKVRADRPVAMHLFPPGGEGPRLWAFDLDAARGGRGATESQARQLAALLRECELPAVAVVSGPSGGRHLWTACEAALPQSLVERLRRACRMLAASPAGAVARLSLSTLDLTPWTNANTGALRPPGAAHRSGGHAALVDHDVDQAVDALSSGGTLRGFDRLAAALEGHARECARPAPAPRLGSPERAAASGRRLPPSVLGHGRGRVVQRQIVLGSGSGLPALSGRRPVSGAGLGKLRRRLPPDADHSAHAWGALLALALSGVTFEEVERQLRDACSTPGLEYFRSSRGPGGRSPRGVQESRGLLARQWELAVECAARMPRGRAFPPSRSSVTAEVADLLARMEAAGAERWSRRTGPADEAVLRAFALIALVSGKSAVTLDVRRGSLLTGFSPQTVNVAIRDRLIPDGWLREVSPPDPKRHLARTVALADSHVCPASSRHVCAVHTVRTGSDTSDNAPRESSEGLLGRLGQWVDSGSSSLWTGLGHHVHRTLLAAEGGGTTLPELQRRTGYSARTVARHAAALRGQGLLAYRRGRYLRTSRTVHEAVVHGGHPDLAAERSVLFRIDRETARWWQAEQRWLSAPRPQKWRRRPPGPERRAGLAAERRAYPRTAQGRPDHARAWRLEAERLGARKMLEEAYARARCTPSPLERHLCLPPRAAGAGEGAARGVPRPPAPPARSRRLRRAVQEAGSSPAGGSRARRRGGPGKGAPGSGRQGRWERRRERSRGGVPAAAAAG